MYFEEDYATFVAKVKISKKGKLDLMTAIIETQSKLLSTHFVGTIQILRLCKGFGCVDVLLEIPKQEIEEFIKISGCGLSEPKALTYND